MQVLPASSGGIVVSVEALMILAWHQQSSGAEPLLNAQRLSP
jgi:hypothetical protein